MENKIIILCDIIDCIRKPIIVCISHNIYYCKKHDLKKKDCHNYSDLDFIKINNYHFVCDLKKLKRL